MSNQGQQKRDPWQILGGGLIVGIIILVVSLLITHHGRISAASVEIAHLNGKVDSVCSRLDILEEQRDVTQGNANSPYSANPGNPTRFLRKLSKVSEVLLYLVVAFVFLWLLLTTNVLKKFVKNKTLGLSVVWLSVATVGYGAILKVLGNPEQAYFSSANAYYHLLLLCFLPLSAITHFDTLESIKSVLRLNISKTWIRWLLLGLFMGIGGWLFRSFLSIPHKTADQSLWFFLTAILLAPIAEESVFRGVILTKLQEMLSANKALILSSFAHALIHIPRLILAPEYETSLLTLATPSPILLLVSAFCVSILFGMAYQSSRSLYCSISMHVIVNAALLLLP